MTRRTSRNKGVTSIFVVIFAALLFSVITLSFAGLMSRDQRRASDDELSQSAFDSALAGVEDAKRVVLAARDGSGVAASAIAAGGCDTIQAAGLASGPEVIVQSTSSGAGSALDQAYTCVKISLDSPDFEVSLEPMKSEIVPLFAVSDFNTIKLEWHLTSPAGLSAPCGAVDFGSSGPNALCQEALWGPTDTTPAMLRAQTITPSSSMLLSDLNTDDHGNTVFLYPDDIGIPINLSGIDRIYDQYDSPDGSLSVNQPRSAVCESTILSTYACLMELRLDASVSAANRLALLRLTALYNSSDVRVTLFNDSNPVNFRGVQPAVDSTGRANDLFRRVEARLSLSSDITYPEAALDVTGPICKDFYVTQSSAGKLPGPNCTP